MISATHFAFSYLVTTTAGAGVETALSASLLSLLPDIDHPDSLVGRVFPSFSRYILRRYGHRTVTHSVFAVMTIAVVCSPALFFSVTLYVALILAFASHIFIDLFNRSGVRLLSPVSQKEYISFRTPELRILVSSWKEYVVLFITVILAVIVTGRSFTMSGAVRSVGKVFFRSYSTALDEYQSSSSFVCRAKVVYFDNVSLAIVSDEYPILNFFQSEIILFDRSREDPRLLLKKDDISEIEIVATKKPLLVKRLTGTDPALLRSIPAGSFVTGSIDITAFDPGIRSGQFLSVLKGTDSVTLTCSSALPSELSCVSGLPDQVRSEVARLKADLPEYKRASLESRIRIVRARIVSLNRKEFYANYSEIMRCNDEIKGLRSKVDSLQGAVVADGDERGKIEKIKRGFSVSFNLMVLEF